jgi:prophage regulatory protein
MRLNDVRQATGLSRSSIYAYIRNNTFPKPLNLGTRAVGWLQCEINEWIEQRTANRGA